jgi:hypothetical protein
MPLVAAGLLALSGCDAVKSEPTAAPANEPSPNASILPAPLVSDEEGDKGVPRDAGRPREARAEGQGRHLDAGSLEAVAVDPQPLRDDQPLEPDLAVREPAATTLFARFRWLDTPAVPRVPETNVELVQRLRDAPAFELRLELAAAGRLRAVFDSDAFVLPRGSELRSRLDAYGHLLIWGSRYRVLPSSSLRALLGERRVDVAPLMKPKVVRGASGNLLGSSTERSELTTPLGRLLLDQASLPNLGSSGELVCRLLVDLIAADPANSVCGRGLVPLRAEVLSAGGGHLLFEVQRVHRNVSLELGDFLTPPRSARFAPHELPAMGPALLVSAERLADIRLRPAARGEKPDPLAPKQGISLLNRSENCRYVLLDGLLVARMPAHSELHIDTLLPGKYAIHSRDFLGNDATPLRTLELPARVSFGEAVEASR